MTTRSTSRPSPLSPKVLTIIATVLSIPFLSFYWMSFGRLIPSATTNRGLGRLTMMTLYVPFAAFAQILFNDLMRYALISGLSIITIGLGLIIGRGKRRLRVWLLVILCAVIAFPLLFRYRPALAAAPGYTMDLVTDPGLFDGMVKASQNVLEQTPCTYSLLGWSEDNRLYYQARCEGQIRTWRHSPAQADRPTPVSGSPTDLQATTVDEETMLAMVRAAGVRPTEYESVTRPLLLASEGLASPNGRWMAAVTQHIYGTQDIILLRGTESP